MSKIDHNDEKVFSMLSTGETTGLFQLESAGMREAIKQMKTIPEILECHYTTGNWSVLIKILCKDNEDLMLILNKKIQSIKGVSRTETFISLEQQIDRQITVN